MILRTVVRVSLSKEVEREELDRRVHLSCNTSMGRIALHCEEARERFVYKVLFGREFSYCIEGNGYSLMQV